MNSRDALEVVARTRRAALDALDVTLEPLVKNNPSELEIRNAWWIRLGEHHEVLPEGWYSPPQRGMAVLIAEPPAFERVAVQSFRPEPSWPSAENKLTTNSLLYAYASPVNRESGLIGDVAVTMYFGNRHDIHDHLQNCFDIGARIAATAELGMTFGQLYEIATRLWTDAGLSNNLGGRADPFTVNIGHTIPWFGETLDASALHWIRTEEPALVSDLINKSRKFVRRDSQFMIGPNMAFTIEARLSSETMPVTSFHFVVAFVEGERHILKDLNPFVQKL